MSTRVTILVQGSSIVYFQRGVWNVVFITDTCHQVKFDSPGPGALSVLAKAGADRTIGFSVGAGGFSTSVPPAAQVIDAFFNLSTGVLHGVRGATLSNLDNIVKPPLERPGRQYIHMTIPSGTMTHKTVTAEPYLYRPVGETFNRPWGKGVAASFAITFTIEDPRGLTMTIRDPISRDEILQFPPVDDQIVISFDNDCNDDKEENDFIHVYDWVRDITNPAKKFEAGKHLYPFVAEANPRMVPASEREKVTVLEDGTVTFDGLHGNCDPVIIEPPPGP